MRKYVLVLIAVAAFFLPIDSWDLGLMNETSEAQAAQICESNCTGGCQRCKYTLPWFMQLMTGNYSTHCTLADSSAGNCDCCTDFVDMNSTTCFASGQFCYGIVVSIEPSPVD